MSKHKKHNARIREQTHKWAESKNNLKFINYRISILEKELARLGTQSHYVRTNVDIEPIIPLQPTLKKTRIVISSVLCIAILIRLIYLIMLPSVNFNDYIIPLAFIIPCFLFTRYSYYAAIIEYKQLEKIRNEEICKHKDWEDSFYKLREAYNNKKSRLTCTLEEAKAELKKLEDIIFNNSFINNLSIESIIIDNLAPFYDEEKELKPYSDDFIIDLVIYYLISSEPSLDLYDAIDLVKDHLLSPRITSLSE